MSKGIITIGQGAQKYIDMAVQLAMSVRQNSPGIPLAVITDSKDPILEKYFDVIVPVKGNKIKGLAQKLQIYDYSPFDKTLFIDADCFVVKPVDFLFDLLGAESVSAIGYKVSEGQIFGADVKKLNEAISSKYVVHLNGGVYMFNKGEKAAEIYKTAINLLDRYDELGIDKLRGQYNEEPMMSLAMGIHNQQPIDDKGKGMRTPIGISGQLKLDVLTGKCGFYKHGEWVEPAIMHFGGDCTTTYFYKRELKKLKINEKGILPRPLISFLVNVSYNVPYAIYVFIYRILKSTLKGAKFKLTPLIPMFRFE